MAQQGLRLVIGADITEAQAALKEVVVESKVAGKQIDKSFGKTSLPLNKSLNEVSATVKKVTPQISSLGNSIETLRAKALARKNFLLTETDIGKIRLYNTEIKALEGEIARLQAVGTSSLGAVGQAGTKAFSFIRTAAQILPGIGIAGIFGVLFDAVSSLGNKADETADKLKELVKPISDIRDTAAAGTQEELSKVNALTNAVLNQALSYKERNRALDQLKEINKSYFGDLTVETAALGLLKTRVDEYTQAIISQAVIKAFSDEIGKLAIELSKQEKAARDAAKEVDKFQGIVSSVKGSIPGTGLPVISPEGIAGLAEANTKFNNQVKIVGGLKTQMGDLNDAIQQAVNESLKFRPLEDPKHAKAVKDVKFEFDALKAIFKDLLGIQKVFGAELEKQAAIRFRIRADFAAGSGSAFDQFTKEIPKISAELQRRVDELTKNNVILKISTQFTLDMSAADAQLRAQLAQVNAIIVNTASDAFAGLGETLGNALAGGNVLDGFKSFITTIANGVQAIGKQLIQFGTIALLAKSALSQLFDNPALSIAAGIALVAAGAALKQALTGGVKGFAQGGLVFGPTLGLVGEGRGTSRSNPEVIAPLDQLKAMLGDVGMGGKQVVVLSTRVRGNDLLLSSSRTSRSNKRLGATG